MSSNKVSSNKMLSQITYRLPIAACLTLISAFLLSSSTIAQNDVALDSRASDKTSESQLVDIQVDARLNLTRMAFEDTAMLTILVSWSEGQFALKEMSAPKLDLLRLRIGSVSSKSHRASAASQGKFSQEYVYSLLPTASGKGVVGPVKIGFIRNADSQVGSVSSSELSVTISMPTPPDEGGGIDSKVLLLMFVIVLVFAGIGVTILRRKRRSEGEQEELRQSWNRLSDSLGELKVATSGSKAEFFDKLFDFLYDLLVEAGHVSTRKGDSDSVLNELQGASLDEEIKRPIVKWLELSANEKFSPGRGTPGESLRVYYEVEAFMREVWRPTDESK